MVLHKYGGYPRQKGWDVFCACSRQMARLQVYHLLNCLRAGERPAECVPAPPPGRTLVEFAAAAWTPFHAVYFRDPSFPGHHREPAWLAFAEGIESRIRRHPDMPLASLTDFIYDECVAARVEEDLKKNLATWDEPCPFGAFRYDAHDDYVALHFHNVYMPESPFEKPERLFQSLRDIAEDIRRRGLAVRRIGVDSWIDYLEPFQALFPASFAKSLAPTSPDNKAGNGWWGQFILRTGAFHEKRAERLRQTRRFDYVRAHGECGFDEFCAHIARK
ncbi:MAG: hypothetical protein V1809_03245 [Planctomycetota bacterium]